MARCNADGGRLIRRTHRCFLPQQGFHHRNLRAARQIVPSSAQICSLASWNARIQKVVFGAADLEAGALARSTTSASTLGCGTPSRCSTTSSVTSAPKPWRRSSPACAIP